MPTFSLVQPAQRDAFRRFIGQLDPASLGREPDYLAAALPGWMAGSSPQAPLIGAWDQDQLVGFMHFGMSSRSPTSAFGEGLRVHATRRRSGIAAGLLEAFYGHLRRYNRCPCDVSVVVGSDNVVASQFFETRGYRQENAVQTLEIALVRRTAPVAEPPIKVPSEDAPAMFDWFVSVSATRHLLRDWAPLRLCRDDFVLQASKGELFGIRDKEGGFRAVAIVPVDAPRIRENRHQIRAIFALDEQSSYALALGLEELGRERGWMGLIAHPPAGSLLAHVLFSRGWRPTRWYQDIILTRKIDVQE